MIRFGNGVVGFFHKIRLPRFTSLPLFYLIQLPETKVQKNLVMDPAAAGLYLTMYGYIPDASKGDKVPDPAKVIYSTPWTHGKWNPAFMGGAKGQLHIAQGLGNISYPGQMNTNVYFAGNNATADSEEGALDSALALAEYAFGVNYPFPSFLGYAMYYIYREVMFPTPNASHSITANLRAMSALRQSGAANADVKIRRSAKKVTKKPITKTAISKARRVKPVKKEVTRKPAKAKTRKAGSSKRKTTRKNKSK